MAILHVMWNSSAALAVTPEDKEELERLVRSGKTEQRVAFRARIILGAASGTSNHALAATLNTSRPTIIEWRKRFTQGGVKSLHEDRPRGRSFQPLLQGERIRSRRADLTGTEACDSLELPLHG